MSFTEAVRSCLNKYATFSGRAPRSEYWFFILFNILATIAAMALDLVLTLVVGLPFSPFYLIVALGLIIPGLAVLVRRLHDLGKSGWWFFIALVPLIGGILLLVWLCTAGKDEPNQYGPNPLSPRGFGGLSPAV